MTYSSTDRFTELVREIGELHDQKQRDYGTDHDSYANVRHGAQDWGLEPWVGAMIRLTDKVRRLQTFARKGTLANENAYDSLRDIAVYALIAHVLLEEHERAKSYVTSGYKDPVEERETT